MLGNFIRIDNSGRGVNYTFDHNSETILVTMTHDIPKKDYIFLNLFIY